ncbi:hypothetical protein LINPERHAP1_LOCUS5138, partial [Linum perenne]
PLSLTKTREKIRVEAAEAYRHPLQTTATASCNSCTPAQLTITTGKGGKVLLMMDEFSVMHWADQMGLGSLKTMTSKEKDRRAYKPWTTQLDAALINAMKDVMENGLIENGKFKPGAYKALEKKLFALFPKVDMKADPNIKSSVKTLKINFDAVQLLKSQSGYGWNDELKCPNIEDQVYDDFVKDYRGTWWHVSRRNCLELRERDMLVNELKKLDGLSEDQMFDATLLLLECNNKLRMFYRLDSIDEKKKFIMRMLRRLNA